MKASRSFVGILIAAGALAPFLARVAFASPSGAEVEARAHFEKGVVLLREEAWAAALAEFERSRALFPTAKALLDAAVCLRGLGRYDDALDAVESALAASPELRAESRRSAEGEARDLRRLVGAIEIDGAVASAFVAIDERNRGALVERRRFNVMPGAHRVRVTAEGFAPFEAELTVLAGESSRVVATMVPASASLHVVASPPDAAVTIDANAVGRGEWEGSLAAGAHHVEVSAPGRSTATRDVTLARGQKATLSIVLDRIATTPASPERGHVVFEVDGAAALSPTFGGELATGCTGACSKGLGVGGYTVARGGYRFPAGVSIGLSAGYLGASQAIEGRAASLQPVGLPASPGSADDALKLRAFAGGAFVDFTHGARFRVHVRFGVGAVVGSLGDARSGEFRSAGGAPYAVGPVGDSQIVAFFDAAPELRGCVRITKSFELSVGVEAMILVRANEPRWDGARLVDAKTDGVGTFPGASLVAPVNVVLLPGLGARFEL